MLAGTWLTLDFHTVSPDWFGCPLSARLHTCSVGKNVVINMQCIVACTIQYMVNCSEGLILEFICHQVTSLGSDPRFQ